MVNAWDETSADGATLGRSDEDIERVRILNTGSKITRNKKVTASW